MSRSSGRWLIILIGAICLTLIAMWNWLRYGDAINYRWFELPTIRAEVAQLPGFTLRGLRNSAAPGEPEELRIILGIAGKGNIALWRPTRTSITGGGSLIIDRIGPCGTTPMLSLTTDPAFSDLRIQRIEDIAAHYDTIEARIRDRGWCYSGSGLEVQEP